MEGAEVIGVCRESTFAVKDWINYIPTKHPEGVSFPIVSDLSALGLLSRLGVSGEDGHPDPCTIILDRRGAVRHFSQYSPTIARDVNETLRLVRALRKVDFHEGNMLVPADWNIGDSLIINSRAGIDKYYLNKHSMPATGISGIIRSIKEFALGKSPDDDKHEPVESLGGDSPQGKNKLNSKHEPVESLGGDSPQG